MTKMVGRVRNARFAGAMIAAASIAALLILHAGIGGKPMPWTDAAGTAGMLAGCAIFICEMIADAMAFGKGRIWVRHLGRLTLVSAMACFAWLATIGGFWAGGGAAGLAAAAVLTALLILIPWIAGLALLALIQAAIAGAALLSLVLRDENDGCEASGIPTALTGAWNDSAAAAALSDSETQEFIARIAARTTIPEKTAP